MNNFRITMRFLLVLGALLSLTACVKVYQRDEVTIASFEMAIQARERDWSLIKRQLTNPTPTARDIRGLELLNRSEADRLRASAFREHQKFDGPAR